MNAPFPSHNFSLAPVQATWCKLTCFCREMQVSCTHMPYRNDWKGTALKKKCFCFPGSQPTAHSSHIEDCIIVDLHKAPKSCCIQTPMEVTRESQHNHNGLETPLFVDAVSTTFKRSVLILLLLILSYCLE